MKNSNPYLRMLAKNKPAFDQIKKNNNLIKAILKSGVLDMTIQLASEAEILVTQHKDFVNSEKSPESIKMILTDQKNFLEKIPAFIRK